MRNQKRPLLIVALASKKLNVNTKLFLYDDNDQLTSRFFCFFAEPLFVFLLLLLFLLVKQTG